ncbi:hypothetical protein [Nostoc sp.]|uniref:hypothetical protein n=1 Tax=Nostoc sp. TaxID=1180 RepID=UPI002FF96176
MKRQMMLDVQGCPEFIAVLAWVQYSFDLSPNLSPTRREALSITPQRYKGWGCSC